MRHPKTKTGHPKTIFLHLTGASHIYFNVISFWWTIKKQHIKFTVRVFKCHNKWLFVSNSL